MRAGGAVVSGAAARASNSAVVESVCAGRSASASEGAAAVAAGKRLASAGAAVERSMTPRWIRIEGNTLSANTGRCDVCGTGKGEGSLAPNRMAIAFIRKSAFLKQ
jgi:hypothetical protein